MTRPTAPGLAPRSGLAFSAMSVPKASGLVAGFERLRRLQPDATGVRLHGSWRYRRFVIDGLSPTSNPVPEPIHDIENLSLTLPIGADTTSIVTEARRFGGRVERMFRDRNDFFDFASSEDEVMHIVHEYHHVALCGHRGPWPGVSGAKNSDGECFRCRVSAESEPCHRARYHLEIYRAVQ